MTALTREQQALVESALDEVTAFARGMARRFRLLPAETEDLLGEVRLELTRTVKLVDTSRDVNFVAYAFPSVKGAILDSLSRRRKRSVFARAARMVASELFPHGADEDDEVAEHIDLAAEPSDPRTATVQHLREQAAQMAGAIVLSHPHPQGDEQMVERLEELRREAHLREALASLPLRERRVLEMRRLEEKTLAEVAEATGDSIRTVQRMEKTVARKVGLRLCGKAPEGP